jgi:hypothetical protein
VGGNARCGNYFAHLVGSFNEEQKILSLFSLIRENQKRAVDSAKLHSRWKKTANAYTDIWENVYAPDAKERLDAATVLESEASEASAGVPYRKSLMLRWEKHVVSHYLPRLESAEMRCQSL